MPRIQGNDVEIEYETTGDPGAEPLLLIAGLGSQLIAWPDEFCKALVGLGFFVIRYDNRDVGLSTTFPQLGIPNMQEVAAAMLKGEVPDVPYTLQDMVDDGVAVLDALGVQRAHVCGASMGGMIAQLMACTRPDRVVSLALVMTTTGDPALPQGKPEVLMQFFAPVPGERAAYIEEMVRRDGLIWGTFPFDDNASRTYRTREYDRAHYPDGAVRQLAALAIPGNIAPEIGKIRAPTVVIHGREDPFYPDGIATTIATTIPGAAVHIIEGMGHSLPREVHDRIAGIIAGNARGRSG